MMRFELGLEEPRANRAHRSALTIAAPTSPEASSRCSPTSSSIHLGRGYR